eukprot:scaffold59721_cov37-Tisochrysis_lutea.AAC.3
MLRRGRGVGGFSPTAGEEWREGEEPRAPLWPIVCALHLYSSISRTSAYHLLYYGPTSEASRGLEAVKGQEGCKRQE